MLAPRFAVHNVLKLSRSSSLFDPLPFSVSCDSRLRRWTSAGPPPPTPSKPGSFSARYDAFIARWPKVYALHRMVVDGSRWCFADIKTYVRLKREITNPKQLQNLTMSELEVLVQMPCELPRVAVTAVLVPIPFGFYVIGFAIIFFPRLILTRHFWSDAQRKKYFQLDVQRSLANSSLPGLLGNPTSVEDVQVSDMDQLSFEALIALASLHSIYPLPGVRHRFTLRCRALRQLDTILASNLQSLTERQLHFHLLIRRIRVAENASDDELREALKDWIKFTSHLNDVAYLCAPIFFDQKRRLQN